MIKLIANSVVALSLMLSASVAAPAWSAGQPKSSSKCPYAKHKHAQPAKVAAKPQAARGVMLVDNRKQDVQILSFGP